MEEQVQFLGLVRQGRTLSTLVPVCDWSEGSEPLSRQYWWNLITKSNGSSMCARGVKGGFGCSHKLRSCMFVS